jgi:DNA-binding transcriptional ArsR family regulator
MSTTGTPLPAANPERAKRDGVAELKALDAVFSALAHPQRRQILTLLLARGGAVRAGDIASRFECSWPTTTRHLRTLEDAGLVAVESQGRERIYALRSQRLRAVVGGWLARFPG